MDPTKKLYWETPKEDAFEAQRAERSELGGKPTIVLERTLFYPEGGGQLGDRGTLDFGDESVEVSDVQQTDDGVIHHVVSRIPSALGGPVKGRIERTRRADFTAQHSAQHALSRALADLGNARTVSARLGAETSTIDIDVPGISDAVLHRAEDRVNDVVLANEIVRAHFPTADELSKMPLRKDPTVTTGGVRVVEICGLDMTPCGGTHVERTGEIGPVAIAAIEKYKGMIRLSFLAGRRDMTDARTKRRALSELARSLSCGPLDVAAQIEKMRGESSRLRADLAKAQTELASLVADRLRPPPQESGKTIVAVHRPNEDIGFVRALALHLASRADVIAICTTELPDGSGDLAFVIECGEAAAKQTDAGALAKSLVERFGGRGGGRGKRAEGKTGAAARESLHTLFSA